MIIHTVDRIGSGTGTCVMQDMLVVDWELITTFKSLKVAGVRIDDIFVIFWFDATMDEVEFLYDAEVYYDKLSQITNVGVFLDAIKKSSEVIGVDVNELIITEEVDKMGDGIIFRIDENFISVYIKRFGELFSYKYWIKTGKEFAKLVRLINELKDKFDFLNMRSNKDAEDVKYSIVNFHLTHGIATKENRYPIILKADEYDEFKSFLNKKDKHYKIDGIRCNRNNETEYVIIKKLSYKDLRQCDLVEWLETNTPYTRSVMASAQSTIINSLNAFEADRVDLVLSKIVVNTNTLLDQFGVAKDGVYIIVPNANYYVLMHRSDIDLNNYIDLLCEGKRDIAAVNIPKVYEVYYKEIKVS